MQRKQQLPFYILPFSFPSSSQGNLFAAHSLICEVTVPAFEAVPSLIPLSLCPVGSLPRAELELPSQLFAPSLKVGLGAVNPFSLRGYSYKKPPWLLTGVVAMAEGVRMHRQAVISHGPFHPRGCCLIPPAPTLPLEIGLKRGFPLISQV